jgi:hypothetical protein
MIKKIDYSQVKIVAWRVVRFVGDTLAGALTIDVFFKALGMGTDTGIKYIGAVALGSIFAGAMKYFRDKADSYDSLIHKLPL